MTIEPLEETLAVPKMDEDELEDVDQPIVSLQPLDMAPCKILLSLPQEILPSDRQAIQEVLRAPVDEILDIVIGSCENDVWEKVELTVSKLKIGESQSFEITLQSPICIEPQVKSQEEFTPHQSSMENPDDKSIVMNVTLIAFEYVPFIHELSASEKLARASHYKELGSKLFQTNNIQWAFQKYGRAFKYLMLIIDPMEDIKQAYVLLKCQCLLNMAACQMKYKGFEYVIKNCTEALSLDSGNVKALYRRGLAYKEQKELLLAVDDLTKAHEMEPENKLIERQLSIAKTMLSEDQRDLAKAMSKMFT